MNTAQQHESGRQSDRSGIFDQKLLSAIKEKKIAPRPRWHFLLKNYVLWITGILALLVGAAAVAVMVYLSKTDNRELLAAADKNIWEFLLLTLPYFWLLFLGLFIFIVYYNFRHTQQGYRYPLPLVVVGSIVLSLMLGILFQAIGLGQAIDNVLGRRAPFYSQVFNRHLDFWFAPAEGRLTGVVIDAGDSEGFALLDPAGDNWQVMATREEVLSAIRVGLPVMAVGQATGRYKFQAEIVRPAGPPGQGFYHHPKMRGGGRFDCRVDNCRPPRGE